MTLFQTGIPSVDKALADHLRRIRALEASIASGIANPPPYNTFTILADGTNMAQVVTDVPARVFGWSFHNENAEDTVYAKVCNTATAPTTLPIPFVQASMPPTGASGHIFDYGGIIFDTGIGFVLDMDIDSSVTPVGPTANTACFELYWLNEDEVND